MSEPRTPVDPAVAAHEAAQLAAEDPETKQWRQNMAAKTAQRSLSANESKTISAADVAAHEKAQLAAGKGPTPAPKPVLSSLPLAAVVAVGEATVKRMLLQAADLGKFAYRFVERKSWYKNMRAIAALREAGDPLQPVLEKFAETLFGIYMATRALVQKTYDDIALIMGMSDETVRKCADFWHRHPGSLDVAHVMGWHEIEVDGVKRLMLVREANAYMLHLPDEGDAETEKAIPEMRALVRFNAQLHRWARAFRMAVRPWGINTTPLASRRLDLQGHPAPA